MKDEHSSLKLEIANSITHGIGILFGLAALPVLSALAVTKNHTVAVVGAAVYGFCFLLLFTFSTLYHAFQNPRVKRVLNIFDHISIYFFNCRNVYSFFTQLYAQCNRHYIAECILGFNSCWYCI